MSFHRRCPGAEKLAWILTPQPMFLRCSAPPFQRIFRALSTMTATNSHDPSVIATEMFDVPIPVRTDGPIERAEQSAPLAEFTNSSVMRTGTPEVRNDAQTGPDRLLPPKPKTARYETLDIVRGMACLMLMIYHAAFYAEHSWVTGDPSTWTWGGLAINLVGRLWMGVPLFFVVSGYCIAASIDSLRRKPQCLTNYFYRRMRRIYPPLWAGLFFVTVFTWIVSTNTAIAETCLQLPHLATLSVTDWLANVTATTSWLPKVLGEGSDYLLPNTWTLCYEEQFYLVTGILLAVSPRRFFLASYLIAAATFISRIFCRHWEIPIDGFFFDGHWLLFVCGIFLYHHVNYLTGASARWAIAVMSVGALYGLAERVLAADAFDRHIGEYILVACTVAMFLASIKRWDAQIAKHWLLSPFRWSGKMSYSLYLTHFPITVFTASALASGGITRDGDVFLVTLPICLLLSFAVAYVFYHVVERRFVNVV